MSDARPAASLNHPARSPAAPVFLWLLIQLLALSLAVFRVPLSARFPLPGEQFAIHAMIVAQVAASALLFPFLLRDATTAAMVIMTIGPFLQLGAYLSSVPLPRAGWAALYVACWLASLALLRRVLRAREAELIGVACATALSVGGAIVWYVRAEAREPGPINWSRDGAFGPILGGIAQVQAPATVAAPWVIALTLLLISLASLAVFSIKRGARHRAAVERSGESTPHP